MQDRHDVMQSLLEEPGNVIIHIHVHVKCTRDIHKYITTKNIQLI